MRVREEEEYIQEYARVLEETGNPEQTTRARHELQRLQLIRTNAMREAYGVHITRESWGPFEPPEGWIEKPRPEAQKPEKPEEPAVFD
jgi:hypothetical protein